MKKSTNVQHQRLFVTVILPIAIVKEYTYAVPLHFKNWVQPGIRVEVQFGKNKHYAALISEVHDRMPVDYVPKPILNILDDVPVVHELQFKLWKWISQYYACPIGLVMNAALPAGLKLSSESIVCLHSALNVSSESIAFSKDESLIIEALEHQGEINIQQIQEILQKKTIQQDIKSLIEKKVIYIKEQLINKFKIKFEDYIDFAQPYRSDHGLLQEAFEKIGVNAKKQYQAILALYQMKQQGLKVSKSTLYKKAEINSSVLNKLVEKGIFEIFTEEVSRFDEYKEELIEKFDLLDFQVKAKQEIETAFDNKKCALLHGVTGSGKTQIYIELMEETLNKGKNVLFLLPEIALTAQMVRRLQLHFGDEILLSHSKFNQQERVELWYETLNGRSIVLGARSALFMPLDNIGLVIVDEEHDSSYKQQDPAPRYHARDVAIYLAHLHKANVILGSATPSVESYYNCMNDKFSYVAIKERFGAAGMPDMELVDIAEATRKKIMRSHFSPQLLEGIEACLKIGQQVILFQNRRGYAPTYSCNTCGWTAICDACDVSMTYHKYLHLLKCHFCNSKKKLADACPACGLKGLSVKGYGTEKIEDEIAVFFPEHKVARLDYEIVKRKDGPEKLIQDFEDRKIDILIGTQMISKGLDFDNVGLVGVLNADQMFYFPDFRASERAFQLMLQVSGRAGRSNQKGRVMIQASNTAHPVLKEVLEYNYEAFYQRELNERKQFAYPPFCRLIKIQIRHKKPEIAEQAATYFTKALKVKFEHHTLGPAQPSIAKIRNYYIQDIILKLGKRSDLLDYAKRLILDIENNIRALKGFSGIRLSIDVDP